LRSDPHLAGPEGPDGRRPRPQRAATPGVQCADRGRPVRRDARLLPIEAVDPRPRARRAGGRAVEPHAALGQRGRLGQGSGAAAGRLPLGDLRRRATRSRPFVGRTDARRAGRGRESGQGLRRNRAPADVGSGADGRDRHPARRRIPPRHGPGAERGNPQTGGRDLRARGREVQPRLAAAARRSPVRKARLPGAQADREDQELFDRGGDPGRAGRPRLSDRRAHPALSRADQAAIDLCRGAPRHGRRRRPHPHPVQPGGRGDRPALFDQPEPAKHSGPHRDRQRIRRAFVAPPGHLLVIADYSQIELRILAHIAEDPTLVAAFEAGEDIHRATAATVLHVDPDLVTPEQRRAAKVINFGILYGMSAFGLAANLKIPQKEADRFIREYLERFPGVRRYIEETEASAERDGKVETLYGRVRWLPDIQSKNRNLRENAKRMAINARIQGTAADLLKLAMIEVDARLAAEQPDVRLLLTVHDELVFEVPEGDVETVAKIVKEEMEGVAELRVPLVVDVGSGASWYEAKA